MPKFEAMKKRMPAPAPAEEELDIMSEDMPEDEMDMEEPAAEAMMDFSDYSDEELKMAVEEAKSRGLLDEEMPAEEEAPME